MKVVIITSFPFPNGKATANRIRVFAEQLIQRDEIVDVSIVSCSDLPEADIAYKDGIRVINLQSTSGDKNRFFLRAWHEIYLAFRLWRKAKSLGGDILLFTIPSVMLMLPMLFGRKRAPIVLDVRDAVWTYLKKGALQKIVGVILAGLFHFATKRAAIVSVTNAFEAKSVKRISGKSALIIANGISKTNFNNMREIIARPLDGKVQLTYVGNVGIAQEIDALVDFASTVSNLNVTIVGDGAKLEHLKQRCIFEGIDNVAFSGFVSPGDALTFMKGADILFAQIGEEFATAIPTKIFEYVACGRKVLLGLPSGPAKDIFSQFAGVEVFQVGDGKAFSVSYEKLLALDFTQTAREANLEILKQRYIREKSAELLIDSILQLQTQLR